MDALKDKKRPRATALTNESLDPRVGKVCCQLSNRRHLPEEASPYAKCALHNYSDPSENGRVRGGTLRCSQAKRMWLRLSQQ